MAAEDRLSVEGFNGSVEIQSDEKRKSVTVSIQQINPKTNTQEDKETLDEWLFSMQKVGNEIQLVVRSPQSKATWSKLSYNQKLIPKFNLVIKTPQLPIQVSWRQGSVSVNQLKQSLAIALFDGNVQVTKLRGDLNVNQQKGQLTLKDIKGDVVFDGYNNKISATQVSGNMRLKNFSGSSRVISFNGQIDFETYNGRLQVDKSEGRVEFFSDRGKIFLNQFKGDIKGKSDQGSISASLVGNTDVRIRSKDASVSLRLPNSAANINVGTKEGSLQAPKFLRLTRLPSLRVIRGRLRGKNPGQVYVRTESGSIRIR